MRRKGLFLAAVLLASPAFAATFTVTNTNDSGAGSLRQAILDANGNGGVDTIAFNIAGSGRPYDRLSDSAPGDHVRRDDRRVHADGLAREHPARRPGAEHRPPRGGQRGRGHRALLHALGERRDPQGSRHPQLRRRRRLHLGRLRHEQGRGLLPRDRRGGRRPRRPEPQQADRDLGPVRRRHRRHDSRRRET